MGWITVADLITKTLTFGGYPAAAGYGVTPYDADNDTGSPGTAVSSVLIDGDTTTNEIDVGSSGDDIMVLAFDSSTPGFSVDGLQVGDYIELVMVAEGGGPRAMMDMAMIPEIGLNVNGVECDLTNKITQDMSAGTGTFRFTFTEELINDLKKFQSSNDPLFFDFTTGAGAFALRFAPDLDDDGEAGISEINISFSDLDSLFAFGGI